jgi:4,5-dihydroxyphthalate decarboxylase
MKALLGDYPVTKQFKETSGLQFADVKQPQTAFKRVVRELEFDVAELAIVTFLLARAHGKPYRLLPAVVTARFQHPYLVSTKKVFPKDLEGLRVGQRSYSVTTATWVRGLLADEGVDLQKIRWVTFEEPHVAEFRDPQNAERAAPGKDIMAMLLAGELDAAILGEVPANEKLKPVFPDIPSAIEAWKRKHGASVQINHMVSVKNTVSRAQADEIYQGLLESKKAAGNPPLNPFGLEDNRRNLEAAIDCVYRQKMIPRRFSVEELFE